MATLNSYKASYKRAKTHETRYRVINKAYLNLNYSDFEKFIAFQIKLAQNINK